MMCEQCMDATGHVRQIPPSALSLPPTMVLCADCWLDVLELITPRRLDA